jgi:hypothetical protein
MDLKEKLQKVVELMEGTKNDWVASEPDNVDLGIYLHFYRGDVLVAMALCPLNRDTALHAGQIGAMGFNADVMSITFESYHSNLETSPITGKSWKPHEMQFVFENHPKKGWVNECLTTTIHERGGGFGLSSHAYRIADHQVEWLEVKMEMVSGDEAVRGGGVMYEYLQQAMAAPSMEEVISESEDPVTALMGTLLPDDEVRLTHEDLGTYQALKDKKLVISVIFFVAPGSTREKMLNSRLEAGAVVPYQE